jgi:hypothetical protein
VAAGAVTYEVPYRLICRGCHHISTGVCSTDQILPEPNGWTCPACDRPLVVTLDDIDGGGIIMIKSKPPHVVAINGWVMPTGPTQHARERQYERLAGTRGKARVTIRGTPGSQSATNRIAGP